MRVYQAHQLKTISLLMEAITKAAETMTSAGGDAALQILPCNGVDGFSGYGLDISCGPRDVALAVTVLLQPFEGVQEPIGRVSYLRRMDEDTDPAHQYRSAEVTHTFALRQADTPQFVAGKLLAPILSFFETEKFPDHPFA